MVRVDTSGVQQSSFNFSEWNTFILAFLGLMPFTCYFYSRTWHTLRLKDPLLRLQLFQRPKYLLSTTLVVLQGMIAGGSIATELYFALDCPVSHVRYDQMSSIFQENVRSFQPGAAAGRWHDRVFAAEGTMLALARGSTRLNIWDQDSGVWRA